MFVEGIKSETMHSDNSKSDYLKTAKIILFVLVAAIMSGCGLFEPEMMESREVKQDVLKLCGASNYFPNDVKVLDWSVNENLIGDAYLGYIVTYEKGTGYYALVNLIEFDNSSRYELELIYRGRSLSDLNDHIY